MTLQPIKKGEKTMSVRSKEEILETVRSRIGEKADDESIAFLEDVTDTLTDLESKANGDGEDWKTKYETNDAEWRKKYTDRFFSKEPDKPEDNDKPDKLKTFDELFKTV